MASVYGFAGRLQIMKIAVKLEQERGIDAVLEAFDALEARILKGTPSQNKAKTPRIIEKFIEQRLVACEGAKVKVGEVYKDFTKWCVEVEKIESTAIMSLRAFGEFLTPIFSKKVSNFTYLQNVSISHAR